MARRDERLWLLGIAIVTGCSWGRWAATGSLKVDESYPSEAIGTALFVALVAGWALLVAGWRGLLLEPPVRPRRLALAGIGVASLMLPMISNDVFSMLAYGSLAAHGRDVYTSAAALPDSVWYTWVGEHWVRAPCVYGPATLAAIVPSALGGASPWLSLIVLRATWLAPIVVALELSVRRLADRPGFAAMVWCNPLLLVEGVGQLHADVLGLAAVVCGIALAAAGRRGASPVAFAVAVLGKYSFAFTGLWFWLTGARTLRERVLRLPALAAALLALGVLAYAPFWRGPATLTEPIRALSAMNPGGSITEVASTVVDVLRGSPIPRADAPVGASLEAERAMHGATWFVVSLVLRLLTVAVGVVVLRAVLRRPHDERRIALGAGALVVAMLTLASHRFQSWYLLAPLPFFGLATSPAWRRWWIAVVAVAPTTEFVYVLPRTAPVLGPWVAATTLATVVLFLISFRARYLRLQPEGETPLTAGGARPGATAQGAR